MKDTNVCRNRTKQRRQTKIQWNNEIDLLGRILTQAGTEQTRW